MATSLRPVLRKLRPWLVGWIAFQAVVALVGRLTARRSDEGTESSTNIRRTVTHFGLELKPTNPRLTRVRVDLAMSGADLDLTALPRPETGIDVTARVMMAGMAIRVPPDWRVWWEFREAG